MKTAERMMKVTYRSIKRKYKDSVKKIKKEIKNAAHKGKYCCFVSLWLDMSKEQQEAISRYFTSKNYRTEWVMDDFIKIMWRKKNE